MHSASMALARPMASQICPRVETCAPIRIRLQAYAMIAGLRLELAFLARLFVRRSHSVTHVSDVARLRLHLARLAPFHALDVVELVPGVTADARLMLLSHTDRHARKRPALTSRPFYEADLAMTYFPRQLPTKYRRRWHVSRPCSGWERVGPCRSHHQTAPR